MLTCSSVRTARQSASSASLPRSRNSAASRTYGRDTGEAAPAARYVLERAAWSEAAALPVRENAFTYAQAIPRFTRAVAAARLGDAATGQERERPS